MRRLGSVLIWFVTLGGPAASLAGCHRQPVEEPNPNATTTVKVINNQFNDVDVFAERSGGVRVRLGTVMGKSEGKFTLPPHFASYGSLRLTGVPLAGFGAAKSGKLMVSPGDNIVFTVQSDLAASMAVVEHP